MSDPARGDELLQRLEQLVPLCESIRKGSQYGAALAQAVGEVRRATELPDRLASIEPALRILQGTAFVVSKDLSADLAKLESAGRTLEQSVDADPLRDARFSVRAAQDAVQRIEALVSRAWKALVEAEFAPLQNLGAVLAGIPETKSVGSELRAWATRALTAVNAGTPTAESVGAFAKAKADVPARVAALGKLGIDAAVTAFLLEVAGGGATLENVTPKVLEWLQAKKAQSRFHVGSL